MEPMVLLVQRMVPVRMMKYFLRYGGGVSMAAGGCCLGVGLTDDQLWGFSGSLGRKEMMVGLGWVSVSLDRHEEFEGEAGTSVTRIVVVVFSWHLWVVSSTESPPMSMSR